LVPPPGRLARAGEQKIKTTMPTNKVSRLGRRQRMISDNLNQIPKITLNSSGDAGRLINATIHIS
jgi:hypothetical protein